jgi:hypothetical protein
MAIPHACLGLRGISMSAVPFGANSQVPISLAR